MKIRIQRIQLSVLLCLALPSAIPANDIDWQVLVPGELMTTANLGLNDLLQTIQDMPALATLLNLEDALADANERAAVLGMKIDEDIHDIVVLGIKDSELPVLLVTGNYQPDLLISEVRSQPDVTMTTYRRLPLWNKQGEQSFASLLGNEVLVIGGELDVKVVIDNYYSPANRVSDAMSDLVGPVSDVASHWVVGVVTDEMRQALTSAAGQAGTGLQGLTSYAVTANIESETIEIEAILGCEDAQAADMAELFVNQVVGQLRLIGANPESAASGISQILSRTEISRTGSRVEVELELTVEELMEAASNMDFSNLGDIAPNGAP